jgi:pyruvate-formate lyase
MSINPIALPPSTLSNVLSTINSAGQTTDSSNSAVSLNQLQRVLRQQIDQAFKQGSSLQETGQSLADQVSATLQQYGVSDDQRNTVVDQLNQIFAQAGSRSDARQNAQQLLDNFVQSLGGSGTAPTTVTSPGAGQNFDASA